MADRPDSSLEASQKHLIEGIKATKLNWSSIGKKDVILRLSKDLTHFTYKKENGNQLSCWDKLKPESKQEIEGIADLSYGAISSTFSRLSKNLIRM